MEMEGASGERAPGRAVHSWDPGVRIRIAADSGRGTAGVGGCLKRGVLALWSAFAQLDRGGRVIPSSGLEQDAWI
jgi:hypothetical protein